MIKAQKVGDMVAMILPKHIHRNLLCTGNSLESQGYRKLQRTLWENREFVKVLEYNIWDLKRVGGVNEGLSKGLFSVVDSYRSQNLLSLNDAELLKSRISTSFDKWPSQPDMLQNLSKIVKFDGSGGFTKGDLKKNREI